jgi:hypothetical protein
MVSGTVEVRSKFHWLLLLRFTDLQVESSVLSID